MKRKRDRKRLEEFETSYTHNTDTSSKLSNLGLSSFHKNWGTVISEHSNFPVISAVRREKKQAEEEREIKVEKPVLLSAPRRLRDLLYF